MTEQRPEALFDSLTLAAVALEIRPLARARFAGVSQADSMTLVLRLAAGRTVHSLLCCIHPRTARVHFTAGAAATERLAPFGLLLRRRLTDARLTAVDQPPFNRLLRLGFDALEGRLWFIAEVMGRHSNLILADERTVLGALKTVTPQMSPRRPVLSGRPYLPPPADRPTPETLDLDELRRLLNSSVPLERRLSQALLGVSPPMAREVAIRAGLDPAGPAVDAVAAADTIRAAFAELAAAARKQPPAPTVYLEGTRVVAFAPFPMRLYAHLASEPAATMSEAVDRYYRQGPAAIPLDDRRRETSGLVKTALTKRQSALDENHRALAESAAADRFRVMGDLILTHAHEIRRGETVLRAQDYTAGGGDVVVPLDPARTPSENAQQYFRRYARARAGGRALPARIARLEAEARALEHALVQIDGAASTDDLWEVETDLAEAGLIRRPRRSRPAARTGPRRFRTPDGATILVGRSGRENDRITFHEAGAGDLWLHARGLAGAHVILKSGGRPSDASTEIAAQAAAYFSAGRHADRIAVDVVERRHVRKPPGTPPGTVTYSGERTVAVTPRLPPDATRISGTAAGEPGRQRRPR